jgi:exopolyphosphatase/guanosine-5'-triphosphate,3'-diphosphate pyrophosphatase
MPAIRRAVIDVGTNSVKLLVADVDGSDVQPVLEDSQQTRLGAGFYDTHRLHPEAVARTARAVAAFAERAMQLQAVSTRVIATSAARDAMNPTELTSAIECACNVKVKIISGEQEASMVFRGVATTPDLARGLLLLLDVGGGSTEFILGEGAEQHFCQSFPLGVLRLLEAFPPADPPAAGQLAACRDWVGEFLNREVRPWLQAALERTGRAASPRGDVQLVGTGGTATILARMEARLDQYDRAQIEGVPLSLASLQSRAELLWGLPLARRRETVGLPFERADVILPGVVIYECLMKTLGFSRLHVSTRGLRFAAVMEPLPGQIPSATVGAARAGE